MTAVSFFVILLKKEKKKIFVIVGAVVACLAVVYEISRKALTKKEMPCYNEEKKFRQPGGQDAYF